MATRWVLGLDILLPHGHPLAISDVVEAYRWLGIGWTETLRQFGLDARLVSIAEARAAPPPPPELADAIRLACFGALSPYEVVVGGRKVVGLAQLRRRNVLLQSGVHLRFDALELARHLAPDRIEQLAGELERRAAGLADIGLPEVREEDVMTAFSTAISERHAVDLHPGDWTEGELAYARG
jgi:lipoate-protein ligase A